MTTGIVMDMARRLSGEPPLERYYIRGGAAQRTPRETRSPARHQPLPRRGTGPARRSSVQLPKVQKSRSLAPITKHMYADMARRPFGKKLPYGSAKTATAALKGAIGPILGRYRLPIQIIGSIVTQGNWALAPDTQSVARQFARAGWTQVCSSGGPVSLNPWNASSANFQTQTVVSAGICGAANQVPNSVNSPLVGPGAANFSATARTIHLGPASNFVDRFHVHATLTKGAVATTVRFRNFQEIAPEYLTPLPAYDPMALPIKLPVGVPAAMPYWMIPYRINNPYRIEQSERSQPSRVPITSPRPANRPMPGRFVPAEGTVIEPSPEPNAPPVVRPWSPTVHVRRPPTRYEREKKWVVSGPVGNLIKELISVATEALDLEKAFYQSIQGPKPKGMTKYEEIKFVLENLDRISLPDLVRNIVLMLVEDALYGRWGNAQKRVNAQLARDFGVDLSAHLPKQYLNPGPVM